MLVTFNETCAVMSLPIFIGAVNDVNMPRVALLGNPSTNNAPLRLQMETMAQLLQVFDVQGNLVHSERPTSLLVQKDLRLAPGIYIVQLLFDKNQSWKQKWIVE